MATTVLFALGGAFIALAHGRPRAHEHAARATDTERRDLAHASGASSLQPALTRAMRHRALTLGAAVLVLARRRRRLARGVGAEFVPKLDEGDVLVEARRLPGVALTESVATDRRLQKALLRGPRGRSTSSSKTGAPELATDPMGIEQTDVYIELASRAASGARAHEGRTSRVRSPKRSKRAFPRSRSACRSRSRCARTSSSPASGPTSRS